jgi:NadR type nicotinamide-nucleotide adenylyltransferase
MQPVKNIHQIKKVCVLGPECTGKTDLSQFLANHYKTSWVEEYARAYLNKLGRPYQQHDLLKIAHGQLRMEDEWVHDATRLLVCDTNLYVIKVWSEFKFGVCEAEILSLIKNRPYDLYLLTYIDIPWLDDPLREHPNKREELYQIYLNEMKSQSSPFAEIKGDRENRRKSAVEAIERFIPA